MYWKNLLFFKYKTLVESTDITNENEIQFFHKTNKLQFRLLSIQPLPSNICEET
jgi:hypothetical protein